MNPNFGSPAFSAKIDCASLVSFLHSAIPPGITLADLSPASRLTLQRAKRKRVSAIQRVGDMMLQQSTREHRAILEAGRKEHKEFMEEIRAARQQEKEGTDTVCSLFRDSLAILKDMSRAMMPSWSEVTQERMQGPEQEHEFEAQPSTSGVGQPTEIKVEVWPSISEVSQPTGIKVEAQPSTSEVAQPTQGNILEHCPVAITSPTQTMSSPTERPSGSLVMRQQSRPHQQTLAGYRAKRLIKAKKPYSPSN